MSEPYFWFRLIKSMMFPIQQFERLCPKSGVIIDLGCGNGFLSYTLASHEGNRRIMGYDWYTERLNKALAWPPLKNLRFETADLFTALAQDDPVDHFICVDVIYLLSRESQNQLMTRCYERLPKGGTLTLKFTDTVPRWKHCWALFQESVSVRLFGISKTGERQFNYRSTTEIKQVLEKLGFQVEVVRLDRWRPYADVVCIATK